VDENECVLMENARNRDVERGGREKEKDGARRPEENKKARGSRASCRCEEEEGAAPSVVDDGLASYGSLER
jgi:hypothetical protein